MTMISKSDKLKKKKAGKKEGKKERITEMNYW